ncbi:quinone-interacting membrane-bound oxidoreductase complex subunit QmoC [Pseudodesulfovibrio sp.]|uniref:quinone-interacting membrane-bound oxidoreductase complex subunit QmoC n=1 Tax=Pseudodesulfovibrio sp. TaxID=2035812 RepID=UPI0026283A01|nr:quinone-interacting membrane-bound oxidoreductase complex subunit QmoC [Pseudodesulfovibrio sp.]MDD3312266.1 quinone-interacting membrane-bound oxidoreductase complex subunit QmoC [Pseudodesulfovibrio sp.]
MSTTVKVQPDLKFVKELQAVGGDSLKKCYQCATCSVVCPLSPSDSPYPRKEMVWAQWGLKDRLVNDIDIWLCHNCGTCSTLCPRGAKPGDLLAALRNMAYRNLAPLPIIGKLMSSSAGLLPLAAVPALIYGIIWIIMAGKLGSFLPTFEWDEAAHGWKAVSDGMVVFGGLFPGDYTIDPIFILVFLFMLWGFFAGVRNMLKAFEAQPKTFIVGRKKEPCFIACLIDTFKYEILQHTQFNECNDEESDELDQKRAGGHKMLMYAFICLMVVTGVVASGHWGGWFLTAIGIESLGHIVSAIGHTPMPLYHPIKLLAFVGAGLGVYGLIALTKRRVNLDQEKQSSSWYDWYLLTLIWTIFLTGLGAFVFRILGVALLAYPLYYVHLIGVFMLLAYLPWSKLGHLVYRTVALSYAKKIGRIPMGDAK